MGMTRTTTRASRGKNGQVSERAFTISTWTGHIANGGERAAARRGREQPERETRLFG
jgi:hypothetical protein